MRECFRAVRAAMFYLVLWLLGLVQLWVMRRMHKRGVDVTRLQVFTIDRLGKVSTVVPSSNEPVHSIANTVQQAVEDAALISVVCDYRLTESTLRKVTAILERSRAGAVALATAKDRHLYAVARPTHEEMLERIRNVLHCATPDELAVWAKEAQNRFGVANAT